MKKHKRIRLLIKTLSICADPQQRIYCVLHSHTTALLNSPLWLVRKCCLIMEIVAITDHKQFCYKYEHRTVYEQTYTKWYKIGIKSEWLSAVFISALCFSVWFAPVLTVYFSGDMSVHVRFSHVWNAQGELLHTHCLSPGMWPCVDHWHIKAGLGGFSSCFSKQQTKPEDEGQVCAGSLNWAKKKKNMIHFLLGHSAKNRLELCFIESYSLNLFKPQVSFMLHVDSELNTGSGSCRYRTIINSMLCRIVIKNKVFYCYYETEAV